MTRKRSVAVMLGAGLAVTACDEVRTPVAGYPPPKPDYPWLQQAKKDECKRPEDFQRQECHKRPATNQSHASSFVWIMHHYDPVPAYHPSYTTRYVPQGVQAVARATPAPFTAPRASVPAAGFRAPSYPGPSPAATTAVSRGGMGATGASIATSAAS